MSDAQHWGDRQWVAATEGFATGLATICPVHWRPLRVWWGSIAPCGCAPEGREIDSVALHELEEVRWMFDDVDAVGRLGD